MIAGIIRFFRAVDPMPSWLAVLTAAVGLYAAGIVAFNPGGVDEALAMLLLWQMLCASTGFVGHASAGHFDPALVRWPRTAIAAGHALHSVWPVMVLWLAIAALEGMRSQRPPLALEPARLAALLFVSVAAWAMSLPSARLVTGSLWLALIVAAATTRLGAQQYAAMLARPDASPGQFLHAAAMTLVCPFLLLGDHIPPRAGTASVLVAAAFAALAVGAFYVCRRDYPLEASI